MQSVLTQSTSYDFGTFMPFYRKFLMDQFLLSLLVGGYIILYSIIFYQNNVSTPLHSVPQFSCENDRFPRPFRLMLKAQLSSSKTRSPPAVAVDGFPHFLSNLFALH